MAAVVQGARYALAGFRLIMAPRLRRFVIIPVFVNIVLFIGGGILLINWIDQLSSGLVDWLPDWLDWLSYLLWPLFLLLFIGLVLFGFSALANLIGAPFNSVLAERCATLLGASPSASSRSLRAEVVMALKGELHKLSYYLIRALPLALLTLIPGIGMLASLGLLSLTMWMLGLAYMDYPLGNSGLAFNQQRALLARRRLLVLGFGAMVFVLTLIPVVNFLVMPAAVCGATQLWISEQHEFVTAGVDSNP
jgi:CysZ protein